MDGNANNLKSTNEHEQDTKPLTAHEIEELRAILKGRERLRWLHSTIRLWAGYISGGLVTLYIIWDYVHKFIQKLFP